MQSHLVLVKSTDTSPSMNTNHKEDATRMVGWISSVNSKTNASLKTRSIFELMLEYQGKIDGTSSKTLAKSKT